MLIHRTALVRADTTGRTLFGTVVPYTTPTRIDSPVEGRFDETFVPGAFSRSIRERGSKVKLFTQHDTRRLPIGKVSTLEERADGLYAEFALPRTRDADEALELVATGTVDGFSIGFRPIRDQWSRGRGEVKRLEAALLEVSLVHSPAYPTALAGVRGEAPLSVELAERRLSLILKAW